MLHGERFTPFAVQILDHKPTMTMVRGRFGTQQTSALQHFRFQSRLDLALPHEPEKTIFIDAPLALLSQRPANLYR